MPRGHAVTMQLSKAGICAGLAIALATSCPPRSEAQNNVPRYEVDPYWPKPLPERWVTGEMGGVCVDSRDHVFIVQRVNDVGGMDGHLEGLTNDELNAGQAAPPVIESCFPRISTAARSTARATCGSTDPRTASCRNIRMMGESFSSRSESGAFSILRTAPSWARP